VAEQAPSVYAALRGRFLELHRYGLRKQAVLRLSRALEEECAHKGKAHAITTQLRRDRTMLPASAWSIIPLGVRPRPARACATCASHVR
jgi:hypothetical protein